MRLAAGEAWDAAAFHRDDEMMLVVGSGPGDVDLAALRAELRLQRFAGAVLPHVNVALASEDRRSLVVVFGNPAERIAILRVRRHPDAKPFTARDGAPIDQFFRQHGAAIVAALAEENDDAERLAARRAAPLAFIVDERGDVVATLEETSAEAAPRGALVPHAGVASPVLRGIIDALLERARRGAGASELIAVLPFAVVRLSPLRRRDTHEFLVSVDWLRSRASLEVAAAQYAISKRELQVLASMLRGSAVATIAAELSISESTVVFHLKRMLKKTASKNRTELAARMLGWEIPA